MRARVRSPLNMLCMRLAALCCRAIMRARRPRQTACDVWDYQNIGRAGSEPPQMKHALTDDGSMQACRLSKPEQVALIQHTDINGSVCCIQYLLTEH